MSALADDPMVARFSNPRLRLRTSAVFGWGSKPILPAFVNASFDYQLASVGANARPDLVGVLVGFPRPGSMVMLCAPSGWWGGIGSRSSRKCPNPRRDRARWW